MAKLLCCRRPPEYRGTHRQQLWHDPHRSALRPLRCAFGPRVSRWPGADRAALLHELGIPRFQAEEVIITKKRAPKKNRWSAGHLLPAGRARRPSLHRHSLNSDFEFRLRSIMRCPRWRLAPWAAPACFGPEPAPAASDLSFRGYALRRRP